MKLSEKQERVRFAPSPTGYLHIGGARTAIFNWLFAKHNNGKFLLRIEDTDVQRSDREIVQLIFDDLSWLGLQWDEEPIFQSTRKEYYQQICDQLISNNKAYYCYCSPERLEKLKKEKKDFRYDGHCRNLTATQRQELESKNISRVVRFKVEKGETSFKDVVYGSLTFNNNEIEDFIILKSDGMPTYHLAVVADDNAMNITTVIRGDDHLTNTPKHIMLYQALGWKIPLFAHVPLILGSDKQRLSKRHGATSISEYRKKGYLPEALFNYLALLGWSPGNNREIMSVTELISSFSLENISRKSAIFDEQKLRWINSQYIGNSNDEYLSEKIIPYLIERKLISAEKIDKDYISKVVSLLKPKIKLLNDFADLGYYFFKDPQSYDEKAEKKYWQNSDVISRLKLLYERLELVDSFEADVIEKELRGLAEEVGLSAAKFIHPARLALTSYSVSPGIFELMALLGKQTVLRRLLKAIEYLEHKY